VACELTLLHPIASPWLCGMVGDIAWLDHDLLAGLPEVGPAATRGASTRKACALFSGSLGDERFVSDVRSWLPGARETLSGCLEACPSNVLIRPHHAHILSDVPGTRSLLASRGHRPVALDVSALLTPSMVLDAEPHIERIAHGLGPMAGAVLLSDVTIDPAGHTVACHMGDGILPGASLGEALDQWLIPDLPSDVVVGVFAKDLESAARWLGWLS
jgi:hypothetical protein